MPFITAKAYLLFLPFLAWLFLKDRKKTGMILILALATLLIADWSSNTLKHFFERTRPCSDLNGVRLLIGCGKSFSMPSNHAANAFAFAAPLYFLLKNKIRYLFLGIALLVSFSRVYVGVHYPSDVLVGAVIGIFLAWCIVKYSHFISQSFQEKKYSTSLFVFLMVIGLFRIYYIMNGPFDLSPDEAHYWEWSRRLDWSYYSKGPFIAYMIHLGTLLFGDTVFGIRISAVFFSTLSSIVLYFLGKRLYDEKVGLSSAVVIQIIPLFSAYGVIFTIDSPFIFFWIASLYFFSKAIGLKTSNVPEIHSDKEIVSNEQWMSWGILGFFVGLGLLTKYTMAFFCLCAFMFLLSSRDYRRLLFTKGPYIALIISLTVFSPVIFWNAANNWITFKHAAGQVHLSEGLQVSIESAIEFFGSQLGVITPLLLMLMAFALWKLRKNKEGAFLFWFAIPVLVFFLVKSIHAKVQANWALPGYITGVIAFAALFMKKFDNSGKIWKYLIIAAILLAFVVTCIAHYPSLLNLPPDLDPTSRLIGWKDLGTEITSIHEQMSRSRPVFIFSDRYQISSELAFYVKGHPVTYCISLGRRMNQYDLWPDFHGLIHHDAIFVMSGIATVPEIVASAFERIERKVVSVYSKSHAKIKDYSVLMCYDFKGLKQKQVETY
jgi:undecaprenyl-diphosphatase